MREKMRWIPFAAWIISLVCLVLSLITLLAGIGDDSLENAAIITVGLIHPVPLDATTRSLKEK
jgi:hypothetical protein